MEKKRDAFLSSLDITFENDFVSIKSKKRSYLVIILISILVPVLLVLSLSFLLNQRWVDGLFFLGIGAFAILAGWNKITSTTYPTTQLFYTKKEVVKPPAYSFLKTRIEQYDKIKGISVSIKAVGGGTSAYEEGNTDYRKSLILETGKDDINILTYYSRQEEMESSAKEFVKMIENKITNAS
jgi:hypothetical protein